MTYRKTKSTSVAAAKASFSAATGYRIENDPRLPSQKKSSRTRRRADPLGDLFETEILPMLEAALALRPVAIFEEMRRRHPELGCGIRRTLERRVRAWRAMYGPEQEVKQGHPENHRVQRQMKRKVSMPMHHSQSLQAVVYTVWGGVRSLLLRPLSRPALLPRAKIPGSRPSRSENRGPLVNSQQETCMKIHTQ